MKITKKIFYLIILVLLLASCTPQEEPVITFEQSELIKNANQYIEENSSIVDTSLKNKYHLTAPVGWINDPNGFSEFNGEYHLFYQYHPYSSEHGPMHWGHQTTTDFISWNLKDVALAPDMDYDYNGCFSGTALVENGVHYLAYTAVSEFQNQSMAYSYDGVTYKKLDELLIDGKILPEGFSNNDFRDPKIFKRNGNYYILVGNKSTSNKQIVLFKSNNVTGPYEYVDVFYARNDLGGILECPDFVTIDGYDCLIMSPQSMGSDSMFDLQNTDSCVYLVGNFSTNTDKFYYSNKQLQEFDKGFSFYAPQTMTTSDGRVIMTAWMRSWSEPNLTKVDNWCGAMTLPRELSLKDGHIYQKPVREIENYLTDFKEVGSVSLNDENRVLADFEGRLSKISLTLDTESSTASKYGIEVFKGEKFATKIYYDSSLGAVVFDRGNCGSMMDGRRYAKVDPIDGKIKLEIFLDVNSVEVFINDGYYTMTGTTFTPLGNDSVALYAIGGTASFENVYKWRVNV